jgi:phosphohistidine phosphatase
MKVLLLLRHAKSSWDDHSLDDHERPLNARGKRDAPRMGALLRERHLTPDVIISSDAVRARVTAEAVAKAAKYDGQLLTDSRLYLADPVGIIHVLCGIREPGIGTVMVVGHNPGLEDLFATLTGEHEAMTTAALAQISLPIDRWRDLSSSTCGTLEGFWRPKDI